MTSLAELDDTDLGRYLGLPRLRRTSVPFADVPAMTGINAEATRVKLGLIALDDGRIVAERPLLLSVRLTMDSVTHLWSDEGAMTAAVVFDPRARRLSMSLQFTPHGTSAEAAASDAGFLHALGSATHLALRSSDGQFLLGQTDVPVELRIDDGSVRFLRLLADVAALAGVDLTVPADVDGELVKDLLSARRILRGEEVRGRWKTASIRLDTSAREAVENALGKGERHSFSHVFPMTLRVGSREIPLGEVRQIISDAEVRDIRAEGDEIVLELVAPNGGLGQAVLVPSVSEPVEIAPNVVLPETLFDELVADLDAPARPSRLRELL